MPDWDVSQVTDMSNAFKFKTSFNADISAWDECIVEGVKGISLQLQSHVVYGHDLNMDVILNAISPLA